MELTNFTNTTLDLSNTTIRFSLENGVWLNATDVAKQFNKNMNKYWQHSDTVEYTSELSSTLEVDLKYTVTGKGKNQGTYIHPDLVVHFARWVNPRFAIACDKWIKDEIVKQAKLEKDVLLKYHKDEIERIKEEAKKLNDYDGYITVSKYLKENNVHKASKDFLYEALTWKGLNKDKKIMTTFRRLPDGTPEYLGRTIAGTNGTPIYPKAVIDGVLKEYINLLEDEEDVE